MTDTPTPTTERRRSPWRIIGWSFAALLILLPLVAGAPWTVGDYVFAIVLILSVGLPLELVMRKTGDRAYRAGAILALFTAFLLIWVNGAVGIIGSETEDVNLLYYGVLLIGVVGALAARFRPRGMMVAMAATALAQAAVAVGALLAGLAATAHGGVTEVVLVNGFFVALWAGSAVLFRAASDRSPFATPSVD